MEAHIHAASTIAKWRNNPELFVKDLFGIELDHWQKEFINSYNTKQRIAAKASKGCGKTAILAMCMWHFMVTRPHAKIIATSISGDNLRDGLWSELAKWREKSEFLKAAFDWRAERIVCKDHKETWFMSARKWSKDATGDQQANTLAGLHADYILFVIDEVGGIPDSVMAAAEAALASGIECKLVICGNPTHNSGPLYRACTSERSLWWVVEITGDPDNPKRSQRIDIGWARAQIKKYGADNPWVLVNVFGQFPPSSFNALLSPDEVEAAMNRTVPLEAYINSPKALGVDVARQGDDLSALAPRQGIVCFRIKAVRIPNTQDLASHVAVAMKKWQPDATFVDATGGLGYAIIDPLNKWGYDVIPVQFSGKATDVHYFNKRTEMLWEMALWIKGGGCLPNDPELKEELCALTYTHKGDKLYVIEKDQIKEEIGRSPDKCDAVALTFAYPTAHKTRAERMADELGIKREEQRDYNPLSRGDAESKVDDYNPFG